MAKGRASPGPLDVCLQGPAALQVPHLDAVAALCGQVAAHGVKRHALDPAVVLLVDAVQQVAAAVYGCGGGEMRVR